MIPGLDLVSRTHLDVISPSFHQFNDIIVILVVVYANGHREGRKIAPRG